MSDRLAEIEGKRARRLYAFPGVAADIDWLVSEVKRLRGMDAAEQAFREYMRGANFPREGADHRNWLAFRAGYRAGSTAAMNADTAVPDAAAPAKPR